MEANKKNPAIDNLLEKITGRNRIESIDTEICNFCGKEAFEFKDEISKKEFIISGLCQKCQDEIWS